MKFIRFIFKLIKIVFMVFVGLVFVAIILVAAFAKGGGETANTDSDDETEYIGDSDSSTTGESVKHKLKWEDFEGNLHSAEYTMPENLFSRAKNKRENIDKTWESGKPYYEFCNENQVLWDEFGDAIFWIYIYHTLVENDKKQLSAIYKILDEKKKEYPEPREFAEIIITFVQDVPYTLIHENPCEEDIRRRQERNSSTYEEYHYKACLPETMFGLQSPAEFSYNLKGDCDTRSVWLYTVLAHYGYDVAVLYSSEYGHAILGINIPAKGDYIQYRKRKYYAVETTNVNWQIGEIPPSYNNLAYWQPILTSR